MVTKGERGGRGIHQEFGINVYTILYIKWGFPDASVVQNRPAKAGDEGLIPGLGRYPGEGNGNLLQYSCLENPVDRRAWWATVHGVVKSWTQLSKAPAYIKQRANKDLLYTTGRYTQYFIVAYKGKESEKACFMYIYTYTYIYIHLNHCHVHWKLTHLVNQLYFN